MEIWNIWHANYWLSGIIKAITAIISIVTAFLLIRLVPQALALPSPEQLRRSNAALQNEIEERIKSVKKAESLNRELVLQASKIDAANKELESFSYSVSHDLRSPLRHIDGYLQLLREKKADWDEDGDRYMQKIVDSTKQMGLLIDNLLAFSRMGRLALQPAWTDTSALVAQVHDELLRTCRGVRSTGRSGPCRGSSWIRFFSSRYGSTCSATRSSTPASAITP
jgi:signal transduction histidine kinase